MSARVERLSDSESDVFSGPEGAFSDGNEDCRTGEHYVKFFSSQPTSNEPLAKKMKISKSSGEGNMYGDRVNRMMAKMGYQEGKGLGKHQQGRVEIIEASKQRGRRGLGLHLKGLEPDNVQWNFKEEEITKDEEIEWLSCQLEIPELEDMRDWKHVGSKKLTIDDETLFCADEILKNVLKCKNVFDELEGEEMRRARTKSNVFETIRGVFFQNRAAVKMANMDAVLDFMFTKPKDKNGKSLIGTNDLLYFADLCAGPGGFSEYVLWRRKGDAKGFGLTLKGPNDFKLEEFFAGPSEMFEPHYGVGGLEGDGDIFQTMNQLEFRKFVLENTGDRGVHFVMADGGFSVRGQENIQEILSKQLYLCQFLVALSILREGGHFVCKLFDIFTPFSVGLVYLMYRAFEQVSIIKPVTSRPANSERYIICKELRPNTEPIRQYMHEINVVLNDYLTTTSKMDVNEIVPFHILSSDEKFFSYIVDSNERLGVKQVFNLRKIQAFTQNTQLYEARQTDIRKECLEKWQIPDDVRTAPPKADPKKSFENLMKSDADCIDGELEELTHDKLQAIKSVYNYRCIVTGGLNRLLILGLGRSHVYQSKLMKKNKWTKLEDDGIRIELPPETLLEAEIVQEFRGEGKGQRRQMTLHVLDGFFLCGTDIRKLHFNERFGRLRKFVKAITKTTRSDLAPITVPEVVRFEEIEKIFNRLEMKTVKGSGRQIRLCYCSHMNQYFHPSGIYLVKTVKDPWMMSLSRSLNRKYWFNTASGSASYECPPDSIASVRDCRLHSIYWTWEEGVKVHDCQTFEENKAKVSKDSILKFIDDMNKH